jgi:hypothetical protein
LLSVAPNTRSTARYTFSKQVSQGSSEWFWNTTARSGDGPAISRLAQIRAPWWAWSGPASRFSSVDLPQPEWPISVMNSPLRHRQVDVGAAREAPLGGLEAHGSTSRTSMNLVVLRS